MSTYEVTGKLYSELRDKIPAHSARTVTEFITAASPFLAAQKFRESHPEYSIWTMYPQGRANDNR